MANTLRVVLKDRDGKTAAEGNVSTERIVSAHLVERAGLTYRFKDLSGDRVTFTEVTRLPIVQITEF